MDTPEIQPDVTDRKLVLAAQSNGRARNGGLTA